MKRQQQRCWVAKWREFAKHDCCGSSGTCKNTLCIVRNQWSMMMVLGKRRCKNKIYCSPLFLRVQLGQEKKTKKVQWRARVVLDTVEDWSEKVGRVAIKEPHLKNLLSLWCGSKIYIYIVQLTKSNAYMCNKNNWHKHFLFSISSFKIDQINIF